MHPGSLHAERKKARPNHRHTPTLKILSSMQLYPMRSSVQVNCPHIRVSDTCRSVSPKLKDEV